MIKRKGATKRLAPQSPLPDHSSVSRLSTLYSSETPIATPTSSATHQATPCLLRAPLLVVVPVVCSVLPAVAVAAASELSVTPFPSTLLSVVASVAVAVEAPEVVVEEEPNESWTSEVTAVGARREMERVPEAHCA
jgi:hypothetical protein